MEYKKGAVFYINRDKRKYHIVSVIPEKEEEQIVYKYFGMHKQWWHYVIESKHAMDFAFKLGLYIDREQQKKAINP